VLEQGRIAESGPVWRIFGDPQHDATRALLQPLSRDIPDDIVGHLHPAAREGDQAIIELSFTGEDGLEPDLAAIATAIGAPVRLLQSALDRIQGHVHGRLLIAARTGTDSLARLDALAHRTRILGYVAPDV
jgi:D-methionine transport system ATP-binding protein